LPLVLAYASVLAALASSLVSLLADTRSAFLRIFAFLFMGISGASAIAAGISTLLYGAVHTQVLPLGLPWLRWHTQLDPLSGFFMVVVGIVTVAVSLYGPGYVREYEHGKQPLSVLGLFTGLFLAGMLLVLLASDAFAFMVAWELMSLSSYFLVAYQHQNAPNRRAAFVYLLMAHVGALVILLAFGVLAGFSGNFTFEAMRVSGLSPTWSSIAFTLALMGFGMKAGLVPVHAWLPEAHPVAPSHISALMSGVMLKVAIYGLIRFVYDLLPTMHWGWGLAMLLIGAASALLGVLYALMQQDLKKLLAYSSVENVGIIFMGLGLSVIFLATDDRVLGVLGFVAALYHILNHAVFKGLLFMGAGAILQSSHERNLDRMGGLIQRLPQTAVLFLVGSLAISALPPLNGFVSEWLTFQAALQAGNLDSGVLRSVIPITAAMLALTGALSAATFVKVYGVAFLGQARTRHVRHAREVHVGMRIGMGLLAVLCLVLGILPGTVIGIMQPVLEMVIGVGLPAASARGWLWLTPVSSKAGSYAGTLVLCGILLAWGISYLVLHPRRRRNPIRRAQAWDCGFGSLTARMQYTSTSFSMPVRRIFHPVWEINEQVEENMEAAQPLRVQSIRHQLQIGDRSWKVLYEPVAHWVQWAARRISRIQTGSIRAYLSYSFFTLLLLLWLIT
jgi:hydrogenase-4 component B